MPLIVDAPQVPTRWLETRPAKRVIPIDSRTLCGESLRIALINNMPDAALEDTELQFFSLLDDASGDLPVAVKLYSLTGVPRTDRGIRHLNGFYCSTDELWDSPFDAAIITGTEPQQPNLRHEPYWSTLASVFDWAERSTVSTILSCLAAHAGILYSDGIERCRLNDKRFGVFDFRNLLKEPLTANTGTIIRFPHSRWNEVQADALASCGYTVLTQSNEGGVDCFTKRKRKSLFVHFQGHPEYGEHTLLKEYRRDIRRYLRNERESYPNPPKGYFDGKATCIVSSFREMALNNRQEEIMASFPDDELTDGLRNTWRSTAVQIYGNWLEYVHSRKNEISTFPVISSSAYGDVPRKRSMLP